MPLPGSAFEDFPKAKPYIKDRYSRLIAEKVREVNFEAKKRLVNKEIKVVIVGKYKGKYVIGYPFYHGPVVLFDDRNIGRYKGFLVKAKIVRVLSDRIVLGKVEAIERKLAKFLA